MKYLLVLIVIVIAVGVWRGQRRTEARERRQAAAPRNPANPANAPLAAPQDMVECAHCGLHLPRSKPSRPQAAAIAAPSTGPWRNGAEHAGRRPLPAAHHRRGHGAVAARRQRPFVRLWQGFLTGRVLIATALLLLQLALLSVQPGGNPLVWLVCLGYLGLTLLVRLTAREQPPSARAGVHWLPVIGVDIAAICLLQVLQTGPLNYSALLAIPILISAVLGNLTLALATTASVTLLTLGWVAWQDLAGRIESTQAYYQASFACAGYFAVAYLTHELARRVRASGTWHSTAAARPRPRSRSMPW